MKKRLSQTELDHLSSPYLGGKKNEDQWEISAIDIDNRNLSAEMHMRSYYLSPNDAGKFHLSSFPALECLSQLTIIFIHVWAGYKEKTREVWMLEKATSNANAPFAKPRQGSQWSWYR